MADISKLTQAAKDELASLALDMAHDKETRAVVHKKLKPLGKGLPDIEAAEMQAGIDSRFAEIKQQTEAEKTKARLETQRAGLITSGRFKPEEIPEVEKTMEKYGIADYEAGAKLYAADTKPASPTPELKSRTWEMPALKKEDMEDLRNFTRNKANAVIGEIISKRAS